MFLPQNIQFLLNLETVLAGKLILEQASPGFATAYVTEGFLRKELYKEGKGQVERKQWIIYKKESEKETDLNFRV